MPSMGPRALQPKLSVAYAPMGFYPLASPAGYCTGQLKELQGLYARALPSGPVLEDKHAPGMGLAGVVLLLHPGA